MDKYDSIIEDPRDFIISAHDDFGWSEDDMEEPLAWEGLCESCIDALPNDVYEKVAHLSMELQAAAGIAFAEDETELLNRIINMA